MPQLLHGTGRLTPSADPSCCIAKAAEELVERDRVITNSDAGGIVDRVGNRGATPQMPSSPTPLAFIGDDVRIRLIEEDHLLVWNVGVDRHFVCRRDRD